jgi:hypothetical protein
MAPVIIVGAIIGAGIGGGIAMSQDKPIWQGALFGAAGGAAAGWGAGALGAGAGGSALGVGEASGMIPATIASEAASVGAAAAPAATSAPAAAGILGSGITGSQLLAVAPSALQMGMGFMNQPDYPDMNVAPIAPATREVVPTEPTLAARTAAEIDAANARRRALAARSQEARMGQEAQSVAAMAAIRDAYTDPRSYLRQGGSAAGRYSGQAPGMGGFRFGTA